MRIIKKKIKNQIEAEEKQIKELNVNDPIQC